MAWQKFAAPEGWRAQTAMGGGRFYDLGAHLVDQLLLLFPQRVESVFCRMRFEFPNCDIDSQAMIVVGFVGGATGVCDLSSLAAISKPSVASTAAAICFQSLIEGMLCQTLEIRCSNLCTHDLARQTGNTYFALPRIKVGRFCDLSR